MKYGLALLGGAAGGALALLICGTFGVKQVAVFWTILVITAMLFTLITFAKNE
jgi:hypothetical protein